MRALHFASIPTDVETLKAQGARKVTMMGARVYASELFASILRHGTFDCILLPKIAELNNLRYREIPLFRENWNRIRFIEEYELSLLSDFDASVICQVDLQLPDGARRRRRAGCSNVPVTGVFHSLNYWTELATAFRLLVSGLEPYDAVICSSRAGGKVFGRLMHLAESRARKAGVTGLEWAFQLAHIPLGVNTDAFARKGETNIRAALGLDGDPIVLYFGRLSDFNKADLIPLILAFSQAIKEGDGAWLILAGDDTLNHLEGRLFEAAERLGCRSRVRVLPNPTAVEKLDLYGAADIFVAPSDNLQETFGLTVVEAMAAGLPVIAADWDGYKDTVVHGETGYLLPTRMPIYSPAFDRFLGSGAMNTLDLLAATTVVDVIELSRALRRLIADPGLSRKLGHLAQERARSTYDWRVVISAYEELWKDLNLKAKSSTPVASQLMLDLEHYDYRDVFRDYGTSPLTVDTPLSLTELGADCVIDPHRMTICLGSLDGIFQAEQMLGLLNELDRCKTVTMEELVSRHRQPNDPDGSMAMAMLCRLAKYGMVRFDHLEVDEEPAVDGFGRALNVLPGSC